MHILVMTWQSQHHHSFLFLTITALPSILSIFFEQGFKFKAVFDQNIIENMRQSISLALLALLALTATAQNVVIASSSLVTTVIAPVGRAVILESYHNANQNNFLGNGAQWIWVNGSDATNDGFTASFQTLFYADCPDQVAVLQITADNIFTAYLNGNQVAAGDNWQSLYAFKTQLTCGLNNLTIVVINKHQGSPGSLIFSLGQDQTNCYQCRDNPSAIYNRNKCQCECSNNCFCANRLQRWIDYPTCGCRCNKVFILPCDSATRFWNERTCSCDCKRRWCPEGQIQDKVSCKCIDCIPQKCPTGQVWNSQTCSCENRICEPMMCIATKIWSPERCACVCPPQFEACLVGQHWDENICSCTGPIVHLPAC